MPRISTKCVIAVGCALESLNCLLLGLVRPWFCIELAPSTRAFLNCIKNHIQATPVVIHGAIEKQGVLQFIVVRREGENGFPRLSLGDLWLLWITVNCTAKRITSPNAVTHLHTKRRDELSSGWVQCRNTSDSHAAIIINRHQSQTVYRCQFVF